ncbi:MAG: DUF294 nucleotidyltransferase-like domain-containing protein [Bacteroidota bacterium]
MPERNLNRFFISIVLPSILAVGFFILLIFVVILPSFERNIMNGKKEMISQLTNSTLSLLEEYHQEVLHHNLPEDSARSLAAKRLEMVRYGNESKDYFWIIDRRPVMIMHPYRPELINTDLSDYKDSGGKLLFVEAAEMVKEKGEGYINYMWQWKDDSTRIVPKLSYVKGFEPWGWIIGTGIYLEDVREEIHTLKNKLLRITLIFTLLIGGILAFIIRQSLNIENRRNAAEKKLRLSRLKYKSLVEASTEGTLMILKEKIIYSNIRFSNLSGFEPAEVAELSFGQIFAMKWEDLTSLFINPEQSVSLETTLQCKDRSKKEVVLSASMVSYAEETGYILIIKEVKAKQSLERQGDALGEELQTSLLLMSQPVRSYIKEIKRISSSSTILEVAKTMAKKNLPQVFITLEEDIIGVVSQQDIVTRMVAAELDPGRPVREIMTAPVITISDDALLYEVLLMLDSKQSTCLATVGSDRKINGVITLDDIRDMQQNVIFLLVREIEAAVDVNSLVSIYRKVPALVRALLDSGSRSESVNRIITTIADAMNRRVIDFGLEELGPPPAKFAFIVMGSEGRGEQTLATDQDNAIIYADSDNEASAKYFLDLGERMSRYLHAIGYQYCKGDIMAGNPKWTQGLENWKGYFTQWLNTGNPQDILDTAIFFDFRYVYGDISLVTELREHVSQASSNKSVFFYHMADSVSRFRPPTNIFGNIVGKESGEDEKQLDVKKMLMPVVGLIRLYSISEKLIQTGSMERLEVLRKRQVVDQHSYEELVTAFDLLMRIRLKAQVNAIAGNEAPGNVVNLNTLTRIEMTMIKTYFSFLGSLQTKLNLDFKGTQQG